MCPLNVSVMTLELITEAREKRALTVADNIIDSVGKHGGFLGVGCDNLNSTDVICMWWTNIKYVCYQQLDFFYTIFYNFNLSPNPQGRIQDLLKDGAPKFRTDRPLTPMGTEGVRRGCAPQKQRIKCNFQSWITWFGPFFLPDVPTQSQVLYLCKK